MSELEWLRQRMEAGDAQFGEESARRIEFAFLEVAEEAQRLERLRMTYRGRHEDAREVQAARTYLRQALLDLDAAIRREMERCESGGER